jgi:hypothetical protein
VTAVLPNAECTVDPGADVAKKLLQPDNSVTFNVDQAPDDVLVTYEFHIAGFRCLRCGHTTEFIIESLKPGDVLNCHYCNRR